MYQRMRELWLYAVAGLLIGCIIYLAPVPGAGMATPQDTDPVYQFKKRGVSNVSFDTCPESDKGWFPENDFLGTIMCGEVYSVWYETKERAWHAKGPNEEMRAADPNAPDHHSSSPGTPPSEGEFRIWGVTFAFSDAGIVSLARGPVVGRLRLYRGPEQPLTGRKPARVTPAR